MDSSTERSRRRFVHLIGTASLVGLTGCGGGGGGGGGGEQSTVDLRRPVPETYRNAVSQGGVDRQTGNLTPKDRAGYQRQPQDGKECSTCKYYIPDKNGDDVGACALVEGLIAPGGWCKLYQSSEQSEQG